MTSVLPLMMRLSEALTRPALMVCALDVFVALAPIALEVGVVAVVVLAAAGTGVGVAENWSACACAWSELVVSLFQVNISMNSPVV